MCLREKVEIKRKVKTVGKKCINRREECFSRCIHRYKHFLGTLDETTSKTYQKVIRDIEEFHSIEIVQQIQKENSREENLPDETPNSNSRHNKNDIHGKLRNGKAWKEKEGIG